MIDSFLSRFSTWQIITNTSIHRAAISIYTLSAKSDWFLTSLLIKYLLSHLKHPFLTQISLPTSFLAYFNFKTLGKCSNLLSFHAFMHFRPRFWFFWDICEIFGLGFVIFMIYDHALYSIRILTMFHTFRCVLDYCWCVLVGLDWILHMMQFIFSTPHVHAFFMHMYPFFSF